MSFCLEIRDFRWYNLRLPSCNVALLFSKFIQAPESGPYTFYISGDDQCEFWMSTDERPTNAKYIMGLPANTWTNLNQFDRYDSKIFYFLYSGSICRKINVLYNYVKKARHLSGSVKGTTRNNKMGILKLAPTSRVEIFYSL